MACTLSSSAIGVQRSHSRDLESLGPGIGCDYFRTAMVRSAIYDEVRQEEEERYRIRVDHLDDAPHTRDDENATSVPPQVLDAQLTPPMPAVDKRVVLYTDKVVPVFGSPIFIAAQPCTTPSPGHPHGFPQHPPFPRPNH